MLPSKGAQDERLSKKMSSVLRHRLHENGLGPVLRPDGYVPLSALLVCSGFERYSEDDVRRVVEENDKQRFSMASLEDGRLWIRANQGHTAHGIDADALLERIAPEQVPLAVHGTYRSAWGGIISSGGLSRMARHHVHLAAGLPGAEGVISGMRASAEIHVWVDVAAAVRAGVPFFRSANGVILTPGEEETGVLPTRFFQRVIDARSGKEWDAAAWAGSAVRPMTPADQGTARDSVAAQGEGRLGGASGERATVRQEARLAQLALSDAPNATKPVELPPGTTITREWLLNAGSKKFSKAVQRTSRVFNGASGEELGPGEEFGVVRDVVIKVIFSGPKGWADAARLREVACREAAVAPADDIPAHEPSISGESKSGKGDDAPGCPSEALLEAARSPRADGVVLFWKETQGNGYLSNWARSVFTLDGVQYNCVEQYIMAMKARRACTLEGAALDARIAPIMSATSPRQQKALGRALPLDHKRWTERDKWTAQLEGARAKFSQDERLCVRLLQTGTKPIAEASPSDAIFGIGLAPSDPLAQDPQNWRGSNILGRVLMQVREEARESVCARAAQKNGAEPRDID